MGCKMGCVVDVLHTLEELSEVMERWELGRGVATNCDTNAS